MPSPTDPIIARYDSLEPLLSALEAGALPVPRGAACVRVHPALLAEKRLADCIALRQRLTAFGLTFVVTSAVDPHTVELRRYAPPQVDRSGAAREAR